MAVNLGSNDGGDLVENAEINITPFIDVILVLMIIFMVAAPLSTVSVPVELPTSSAQQQPRPDKPVYVSIKSDLSVTVGEDTLARADLGTALDGATKGNKEERIFLRADKGVPYGELMQVMNLLRGAGYLKVGLVGLEEMAGGAQP
ncbi:biopolymer transporter [Methylobacterium sp. Leaf113]|jgi:biopolymer transport protein ExbD|uniref:TonB system transport protein ExbD n=1 Tax=Methylobacterium sp. Leaf113 TaxID=1736259 RepID=UPI0006F5FAA3|nr:TonB system transport protein ExbD [Methylobacterium sp. Leaf113]KQP89595.1 biopolymer transporter [Methylobacterium sp. Leaf113]